ncbi:unnamed protein product, partial [Ectocarpus sp. 12 AP-2014]
HPISYLSWTISHHQLFLVLACRRGGVRIPYSCPVEAPIPIVLAPSYRLRKQHLRLALAPSATCTDSHQIHRRQREHLHKACSVSVRVLSANHHLRRSQEHIRNATIQHFVHLTSGATLVMYPRLERYVTILG